MVTAARPTFLLFVKDKEKSVPFFSVFEPSLTVGTGVSAYPAQTFEAGSDTVAFEMEARLIVKLTYVDFHILKS